PHSQYPQQAPARIGRRTLIRNSSRAFWLHEWGALAFVVTVILGLLVVPAALILEGNARTTAPSNQTLLQPTPAPSCLSASSTPSGSAAASPSSTPTPTPKPSASGSLSPSATVVTSASPTPCPSPSPTASASPSGSPKASASP